MLLQNWLLTWPHKVGWIPSAAVADSRKGGCLLRRGVSAPEGGVCSGGRVSAPRGWCIPPCTEADTPLWTDRRLQKHNLRNFVAGGNKIKISKSEEFHFGASFWQKKNKTKLVPEYRKLLPKLNHWTKVSFTPWYLTLTHCHSFEKVCLKILDKLFYGKSQRGKNGRADEKSLHCCLNLQICLLSPFARLK